VPSYVTFSTAIGRLAIAFDGDEGLLLGVSLPSQTDASTVRHLATATERLGARGPLSLVPLEAAPPAVRDAAARLSAHLSGDKSAGAELSAIALDERRLSPFRRRVYHEARRIPPGELASYAALAERAGSPKAARAVGRAMATNPWPLVVPCHRVVSAEGDLHGFSAPGGTRTKATLLEIEGYKPPSRPPRAGGRAGQGSLPFDSSD